jgi:pimeloyl-ACP methyl ester carboxylesterase
MAETTSPNHNPEIGVSIDAGGLVTNYHDAGSGKPVVLLHGSGPGVTAWANWRLTIPELAPHHRVLAPDITGSAIPTRPLMTAKILQSGRTICSLFSTRSVWSANR